MSLPSLGSLNLETLSMGTKQGKRQKTAVEIEDTGSVLGTLNAFGCVAVPLPLDSEEFVADVDSGARAWFYARLDAALGSDVEVPTISKKGEPDAEKMEAWRVGQAAWSGLRTEIKVAFLVRLDLQSQAGRDAIFIPATRKAKTKDFADHAFDVADTARSEALAFYLADRVAFVKQGDLRMGLSAMYKSWSRTGFGLWAHIVPEVGLRAALQLRDKLGAEGLPTRLVGGSHMIYKPPKGSELPAHTDGPRPATIIAEIARMAAANGGTFPTTSEWMKLKGVQSLVHYKGGTDDGYTYGIGPMTPQKLYVCLKAVQDGSIGVTDEKLFKVEKKADDDEGAEEDVGAGSNTRVRFLTGGTGPSFMRWKENIDAFNVVLAAAGLGPIGEVPIRPPRGTPTGAFVAMWPIGFPHGSAPNARRRITTTASLSPHAPHAGELEGRDGRVPVRVDALAKIANPASEAERVQAREVISTQTEPFYGGLTHRSPEHAGTWFDSTMLSSGTGGWYASIAPTRATAADFVEAWKQGLWVAPDGAGPSGA